MQRVYLDNNATTMVDPMAKGAMEPFWLDMYGNPNSLHSFGTEVHNAMRVAYDRLYEGIKADDEDDILITSCATESNNSVLKSIYYDFIKDGKKDTIITTDVEHPSVLATCKFLESLGAKVIYLPVNSDGLVSVESLKEVINDRVALVSVMMANNETGIIFPIKRWHKLQKNMGLYFTQMRFRLLVN